MRRLVLYDGLSEENDVELFRHRMALLGSFTANQNGSIRAGQLHDLLQDTYFDLLEVAFPYQESGRPKQQNLSPEETRKALMEKVAALQKQFSQQDMSKPLVPLPKDFKPPPMPNVR